LVVALTAAPTACAADGTNAEADRRELSRQCDSLVASAAKTAYGWGWTGTGRRARTADGRAARGVTIDLRATAAAGLVLHVAGQRLDEPRFTAAAAQAGRAVAAVQMKSGQIPAVGVVRANAGGRDDPLEVPSRSATCAGLGLLLTLTHDAADPGAASDAPARRAAAKAAHWLTAQQTSLGGFLVAEPPDARPGEGTRIVRLDRTDYRDAFIALHLAAHVLDDKRLAGKAAAAVDDLDVLRVADPHSVGFRLWSTAYTPNREMLTTVAALAPAADTVASRNAMQALLAACLLGDGDAAGPVVREAAAALAKLPKDNGTWRRRYDLHGEAPVPPQPDSVDAPVSDLFKPNRAEGGGESPAASGVPEVMRAVRRLTEGGTVAFRQALDGQLRVEHRLALVLCGMGDVLLTEVSAPPESASAVEDAEAFSTRLSRMTWLAWRLPPPRDDATRPVVSGEKSTEQ
jgi:hypothetical protein